VHVTCYLRDLVATHVSEACGHANHAKGVRFYFHTRNRTRGREGDRLGCCHGPSEPYKGRRLLRKRRRGPGVPSHSDTAYLERSHEGGCHAHICVPAHGALREERNSKVTLPRRVQVPTHSRLFDSRTLRRLTPRGIDHDIVQKDEVRRIIK